MRSGRLLLIVGLVIVLLVAGVAVYVALLGGGVPEPAIAVGEEAPQERELMVAAQNIPRGMLLLPESNAVVTATWPQGAVSAVALTSAGDVYGRIARQDIPRGMPIVEGMLASVPGELGATGSEAALQIPSGKVAYALAVSQYSSVAWALEPGDHVDVLISLLTIDLDEAFQTVLPNEFTCVTDGTGGEDERECEPGVMGRMEPLPNDWVVNIVPSEGQRPRMVTQLTVQDAIVLQMGDWDEALEQRQQTPTAEGEQVAATPPAPGSAVRPVTLVVSPQDAAVLKFMEESGASIDLVLRSAADGGRENTTESVTLQYLFEQFGIELPPKLPYGVQPPLERLQPGAASHGSSPDGGAGRVPYIRGVQQPVE